MFKIFLEHVKNKAMIKHGLLFISILTMMIAISGCKRPKAQSNIAKMKKKKAKTRELRPVISDTCKAAYKKYSELNKNEKPLVSKQELVRVLEARVKKFPANVLLKYELATAYWENDDYSKASSLFRQVVFMANSKKHHLEDGTLLADAAKYFEVKSMYDGAIRKNPQCDPSNVEKAMHLCTEYLKANHEYGQEDVKQMLDNSKQWLFQKYANNLEHYLTRNNISAAEAVLSNIKSRFVDSDFAAQTDYLTCRIIKSKYELSIDPNKESLLRDAANIIASLEPDTVWRKRATSIFFAEA